MKSIKFVGLDVHAETIAVAVAEQDGEVRSIGVIPNGCESVRKLVKKLGPVEELRFCYEAGPKNSPSLRYIIPDFKLLQSGCNIPTNMPRDERMPSFPTSGGRRSKRVLSRRGGSIVINLNRNQQRLPCLVLDSSNEGFRLRGSFRLRQGQVVEIILDQESLRSVCGRVVWVGTVGSKQEGEVGLEIV